MQIVRSGYGPNDQVSSVGVSAPLVRVWGGVTIVTRVIVTSPGETQTGPNRSFIIASQDNNLINHKRFINICPQPATAGGGRALRCPEMASVSF